MRAEGVERRSINVYGAPRNNLIPAVYSWAGLLFSEAQRHALAYEVDIVPRLDVAVGDIIQWDTSYYGVWDRATGSRGYSGPARVIGRQLSLKGGYTVTLTLLVLGAASILAWTGAPPAATDTIDIPGTYFDLMTAYIGASSPFTLIAYLPSADDATTDGYTINSVSFVGGNTRLVIAAVIGAPVPTTDWFLTLPVRGSANTAQAKHLFEDSVAVGGAWI
jgi:hypothetical protein